MGSQFVFLNKNDSVCEIINTFVKVRDELDDIIGSRGRIVVINITDSPWATAQIEDDILLWMKRNI